MVCFLWLRYICSGGCFLVLYLLFNWFNLVLMGLGFGAVDFGVGIRRIFVVLVFGGIDCAVLWIASVVFGVFLYVVLLL